MVKRTIRGAVQLLGGLGAGLAIVFVVIAWRLSSGPISLAFLTPHLESSLNDRHHGFRIRLDDTILTWAGWSRALDVRIVNVRAIGEDGTVIATVPELSISLSAAGILHGQVALRSIELFRPRLRLVRRADGSFDVGFLDADGQSERLVDRVLHELATVPDPARPMSYLSRVSVVDAALVLEDRALGITWHAPASQILLRRDDGGIRADISLDLSVEGKPAHVSLVGNYGANRRLDVGVTFSEVSPAAFAGLSPRLEPLRAIDVPLQGTLTVSLAPGGALEGVGFDLIGRAGRLALPAPLAQVLGVARLEARGRFEGGADALEFDSLAVVLEPGSGLVLPASGNHRVPLASLRAKGSYAIAEGRLGIDSLEADLDGPGLRVAARVDGIGGVMVMTGEGVLTDVRMAAVTRYWPAAWGRDPRDWVIHHLSKGVMTEARARFSLAGEADAMRLIAVDGGMTLKDFDVDYLPPMPKATKVSGTATFDRQSFAIRLDEGRMFDIGLRRGSARFTGLDVRDQYLALDLTMAGPLRTAMRLIDHRPLGFAGALGIRPDDAKGSQETRLRLNFIVEKSLTIDQVAAVADATVTDASLKNAVLGQDLSEGALSVHVEHTSDKNKSALDVKGTIKLAGIPARLDWHENLAPGKAIRSRYDLAGRIPDVGALAGLGLDLGAVTGDRPSGAAAVRMTLTRGADGTGRLAVDADLAETGLAFPAIAWSKPAGVAGRATAEIALDQGRIAGISSFEIAAGDLEARGSTRHGGDGGLQRIDFARIAYGRTDMKGAMIPGGDGGWTASFHGDSFDLEPLFEDFFGVPRPTAEPATKPGLRFSLSADLNRVWVGPERELRQVRGTFVRNGDKWRTIQAEGLVGADKRLSIRLNPTNGQKRRLLVESEDAGATLKTLDFYDNMIGGTLKVDAAYDDSKRGSPLAGRVTINDYRILNAPVLARLVSVLALTGILDALQGQGLAFAVLDAPFTLGDDGVIEVADARATGRSLGFTAAGRIYTHADVLSMQGTVVPAYAINSALGRIPLVGSLFSGGEEGGGVFAARYEMNGAVDRPKVTVNPLSALAPGILRNLFGIFDQDKSTSELPLPDASKIQ